MTTKLLRGAALFVSLVLSTAWAAQPPKTVPGTVFGRWVYLSMTVKGGEPFQFSNPPVLELHESGRWVLLMDGGFLTEGTFTIAKNVLAMKNQDGKPHETYNVTLDPSDKRMTLKSEKTLYEAKRFDVYQEERKRR